MKQSKTIIAAICRTLLGVVFVFSGAVKAIDPLGTVYKIEDYLKAFGKFLLFYPSCFAYRIHKRVPIRKKWRADRSSNSKIPISELKIYTFLCSK